MAADERRLADLSPTLQGVRARPDGPAAAWDHMMRALVATPAPHIQRVLEVEDDRAVHLSAVEGDPLADHVGRGLAPIEVSRLLGQIAAALAHLHDLGGAHGNLSLTSIRLTGTSATVLLEDAVLLGSDPDAVLDAQRLDGSACVELLYFLLTGQHYEPGPLGAPSIPREGGQPVPPSTLNPLADVNMDAVALTATELPYPTVCRAIALQLGALEASAAEESVASEAAAQAVATHRYVDDNAGIQLPLPPATRHPLRSAESASQGTDPANITGALSLQEARAQLAALSRETSADVAPAAQQAAGIPLIHTQAGQGEPALRTFDEPPEADPSESGSPRHAAPSQPTPPSGLHVGASMQQAGEDDVPEAGGNIAEHAPAAEESAGEDAGDALTDQEAAATSQIPLVELQQMNLDPTTAPSSLAPAAKPRRVSGFFRHYFGPPIPTLLSGRDRNLIDTQRFALRTCAAGLAIAAILGIGVLLWPLPKPVAAPDTPTPSTTETSSENPAPAQAAAPEVAEVTVLDPEGDGDEHPELLANLTDGNPETVWVSRTYQSDTYGIKKGIGLLVTLKQTATVSQVTLTGLAGGGTVELKTSAPEDAADAQAIASSAFTPGETTIHFDKPIEVDRIIVWVPQLPTDPQSNKFRLALSGVSVG